MELWLAFAHGSQREFHPQMRAAAALEPTIARILRSVAAKRCDSSHAAMLCDSASCRASSMRLVSERSTSLERSGGAAGAAGTGGRRRTTTSFRSEVCMSIRSASLPRARAGVAFQPPSFLLSRREPRFPDFPPAGRPVSSDGQSPNVVAERTMNARPRRRGDLRSLRGALGRDLAFARSWWRRVSWSTRGTKRASPMRGARGA